MQIDIDFLLPPCPGLKLTWNSPACMGTRNSRANPSLVQQQPGGGSPAQRETETEGGSIRPQSGAYGEKQWPSRRTFALLILERLYK